MRSNKILWSLESNTVFSEYWHTKSCRLQREKNWCKTKAKSPRLCACQLQITSQLHNDIIIIKINIQIKFTPIMHWVSGDLLNRKFKKRSTKVICIEFINTFCEIAMQIILSISTYNWQSETLDLVKPMMNLQQF